MDMLDTRHNATCVANLSPKPADDEDGAPQSSNKDSRATPEDAGFVTFRRKFPDAPEAELLRFCCARPNSFEDACAMYTDYVRWRQGDGSEQNLTAAMNAMPGSYIRYLGAAAHDGTPTFFIHAAYFNKDIPAEQFVLGVCHKLGTVLAAEDDIKVTALVDVRLYKEATNILAPMQVPYLKLLASTLPKYYPERLAKLVIYPIPFYAKPLWAVVAAFLDQVTREKIVILSGGVDIGAPCPKGLADIIDFGKLPEDLQESHLAISSRRD